MRARRATVLTKEHSEGIRPVSEGALQYSHRTIGWLSMILLPALIILGTLALGRISNPGTRELAGSELSKTESHQLQASSTEEVIRKLGRPTLRISQDDSTELMFYVFDQPVFEDGSSILTLRVVNSRVSDVSFRQSDKSFLVVPNEDDVVAGDK